MKRNIPTSEPKIPKKFKICASQILKYVLKSSTILLVKNKMTKTHLGFYDWNKMTLNNK